MTSATPPPAGALTSSAPKREPSLGRIVLYRVTENDAALRSNGLQPGDQLPAVVVRVWKDQEGHATSVNLRVLVDGPADGWKTSVQEGAEPGTWSWPHIQ